MDNQFDWVETFESLAEWIKNYEDRQPELINILENAGVNVGFDKDKKWNNIPFKEIDPFTFFALLWKYAGKNGSFTNKLEKIIETNKINTSIPKDYSGMPTVQKMKAMLFPWLYEKKKDGSIVKLRKDDDIKNLWKLFKMAANDSINNDVFNACLSINSVGLAKLTQALFWFFPDKYFPIDSVTIPFLEEHNIYFPTDRKATTWKEYEKCLREIRGYFGDKKFYELSYDAYIYNQDESDEVNEDVIEQETISNDKKKLISPPLNQILYGAAGTGKTYHTINKALEIIGTELDLDDDSPENREAIKIEFDEWRKKGNIEFITFHQSFSYEDFVEGIRVSTTENGQAKYEVKSGIFKKICDAARKDKEHKFVLIIDEINRGNISRIFGELITLIEESKREGNDESLSVVLPYSPKESFSVPKNLYIIGTMNSSDRSLTGIDIALRRRFEFIEMMPDPEVLEGISVEGIDVQKLLMTINQRIEVLLDRDHTIGHANFIKLKETPEITILANIFKKQIIPLLQEYFYDDWEKINWVLNNNGMLTKVEINIGELFPNIKNNISVRNNWKIVGNDIFGNKNKYIDIYSARQSQQNEQQVMGKEDEK